MLKEGNMAIEKHIPSCNRTLDVKSLSFPLKVSEKAKLADIEALPDGDDVDVDCREVYFLIMHFLSSGPCQRTCGQFWNELLEHDLLPRRYHTWYSRSGAPSGDENDDGLSFPLSYNRVVERFPHIKKDHLVKLLKQLLLNKIHPQQGMVARNVPNAADVPTLLGTGSFSLLDYDGNKESNEFKTPVYMRWPHMQADQVRGLRLREIGGGFSRHHRAPSTRAACYAIVKPSILVQKMQNIKKTRGHRNAVYCATFDRSGRFAITGSDDRLVKIWSMETAYCLASCRGHEGDITDLAVSSNNALVASSSNDFIIRVWRLPDGQPISVLRGHTGAVTAIVFSPRPSAVYQLLSSADDGTCRLWDARYSQFKPRVYLPRPSDSVAGKSSTSSSSAGQQNHQIFCCAFNASGTVFVTGSSDNLARVWNACKSGIDDLEQPIHEMDVLSGHENDVNYVQFSGCAVSARLSGADTTKEENFPKFKNSWFAHDNIVTCSRDGSAIIWTPRSRKSHGKAGRWTRAYHLKVPPPPMPPQPPRGGPRQRVLPTPRGVNMIAWSLDNRFVLAAIMDCRICVWNAVDGSLVHSLTGHTESTYVLDVHPFNPRIAMSAGYDGKTIIWDIWEGKPIRTYEIGRFKLVDGKFSPDGTSIVLSDDVGQLYILSTGQGESQKDAEYDQFFLGDYRPLIRDTHGNVVDQETQLPPYRRNMQDLLCDSSMIPYPEPYQSLYQQRRLGILGIEWRPSTVRFAVGPDFNSDQDQILPLPDLDVLIDPLPEFVDAMDWEPEIEIISDDADSEFNITDSSGDEDGEHIISTSSGGSEGSDEDSGPECGDKDSLRRSKRRKKKREMEITSSGRRVKRRNLDECDGSSHGRVHAPRKSRNGPKSSRKKSSNGSRPRRAAARNALTLFSKIKGRSSDQDENCWENESSKSDSVDDSNLESDESDEVPNKATKHLKGKEVLLDDSESVPRLEGLNESNEKSSTRRRLVLKLPLRDSNRDLFSENLITKPENPTDLAGSSASASGVHDVNGGNPIQRDMDSLCGNANLIDDDKGVRWLAGYGNDKMKWGGFRARTPKRIRLNKNLSTAPGSIVMINMHNGEENNADLKHVTEQGLGIDGNKEGLDKIPEINEEPLGTSDTKELINAEMPGPLDSDGVQNDVDVAPCFVSGENHDSQYETKGLSVTDNGTRGGLCVDPISMSYVEESPSGNHKKENHNEENPCEASSECRDPPSQVQKSEDQNGQNGSTRSLVDSHSPKIDRMYSAVYRRSRSLKTARASSNSHDPPRISNCQNANGNAETNGCVNNGTHHLVGSTTEPRRTVEEEACNGDKLPEWPRRAESSPSNKAGQLSRQEWGSGTTVRQRSTRNRRVNFIRDISPSDSRKSSQPLRKQSWLMFSLPDSSRYIPQQGDEVVYLRQGHQEYMSYSRSSARGPWELLKGEIRAVEFCKIIELEYSTVPGSGDSCCKLSLAFTDPSASVFGKTFKLSLPEVTSFPDFLVERTRYDGAIQRNWAVRDKCQVWWKNEGEEDGSWWEGRILAVKPKSPDFPDSPWERYHIRYKSDPAETHSHSPWELHDADMQWERPHLEDHTRATLLGALSKLVHTGNRAKDIYGVQKLRQVSEKTTFLNRFPVPLSIDVILSRVENNYYRSSEALKHDVKVMLTNAESFFGKNAELSKKIARLSEWFDLTLSSL